LPQERILLTKINELDRLIEVLRKPWLMARNTTKLLLTAVVLGAVNQACAFDGGTQEGAFLPSMTAVEAYAALSTRSEAGTASDDTQMAPTVAIVLAQAQTALPVPGSVTVSPLADPALRTATKVITDTGPVALSAPTTLDGSTSPSTRVSVAFPSTAPASQKSMMAPSSPPRADEAESTHAFRGHRGLNALDTVAPEPVPDEHSKAVYDNLWSRMRAGFSLPNLESALVERHTDWYANRPEYVQRVVARGRRYMHFVVEELEKRGMPLEIALLPVIESAYNPTAYSKAHASGIWQFIPATGRNYGLKQNWWYDGRRDVTAATRAALDYLEKLHGMFGDWRLALAAYNWGEGAVGRAIERNQRQGLPTDYESLRMPEETRNYIPKLQAVKNIVADPERYGLALDDVPNEPYFIRVAAPGQIDFKRAAQLAETPIEEFRSLNPAHNRPVITSDSGSLLIPADKAEVFSANLSALERPLVSWQTYRLTRNEHLETIAARFGTTPAQLILVNDITPGRRLKAGSTLLVPIPGSRPQETAVSPRLEVASFTPPETVSEPRTYRAHPGDTLRGIAGRHGVTIQQLMHWNHLRTARVQAGQVLRLSADAGPNKRRTAHDKTSIAAAPRGKAGSATAAKGPKRAVHEAKTADRSPANRKHRAAAAHDRTMKSVVKTSHVKATAKRTSERLAGKSPAKSNERRTAVSDTQTRKEQIARR